MAQITRSSILLWMQDLLGLQSGSSRIPVESSNVIQPVVEVGPRQTKIVKASNRNTTTNGLTIYTTPADKDFYLTYVNLSVTKDVACDNTAVLFNVTVDGAVCSIAPIASQTTTAGSYSNTLALPYPIKVDRNTNIQLVMAFAAGTMTTRYSLGGFVLE